MEALIETLFTDTGIGVIALGIVILIALFIEFFSKSDT